MYYMVATQKQLGPKALMIITSRGRATRITLIYSSGGSEYNICQVWHQCNKIVDVRETCNEKVRT